MWINGSTKNRGYSLLKEKEWERESDPSVYGRPISHPEMDGDNIFQGDEVPGVRGAAYT